MNLKFPNTDDEFEEIAQPRMSVVRYTLTHPKNNDDRRRTSIFQHMHGC